MRNNTITTSYLLARKKKPSVAASSKRVRLVGDQLPEKGKTRQLICRGENREYLSWMHKNSNPPQLFRGGFFDLPDSESDYDLISNEIRIKK